jgi:hypothetical protein
MSSTILLTALLLARTLTCFFCLDLLWRDREPAKIAFKAFASIGLGFGASSIAYFIYLHFLAGKPYFQYLELSAFLASLFLWIRRRRHLDLPRFQKLTPLQIGFAVLALLVFSLSLLGITNYAFARIEGNWDTWMIYNRSARFIYRGGELWQDAFSTEMDTYFHPDYPPMLALNVASLWDTLGWESENVPLAVSLLFPLACAFACFSALASLKSFTQASLGLILLWGTGSFVYEGGRQMADIPLAFFILVSVIFYLFHDREGNPILLSLAGFSAGLAAWTKNEGILFVFVSLAFLFATAIRERSLATPTRFLIGLAVPLAMLVYFKALIAPPSEFIGRDIPSLLVDPSRHRVVFNAFRSTFLGYGPEKIPFFLPLLIAYAVVSYSKGKTGKGGWYAAAILALQLAGYYFFYLISPYELEWHIIFSIGRLFDQVYPLMVFTALYIGGTTEDLFAMAKARE